jgi:colanic acid/amylovoran biosynthesis glycosyltransferase
MPADFSRTVVAQSLPVWLPLTESWVYHQLQRLPSDIVCHVVCERTQNLDQFGFPNIHSLAEASASRRILDRGLRRARVRRYLGLLPSVARQYGAKVLHSHFGNIAWCDIHAARRAGVTHIATFYGFDVGMLPKTDAVWRSRYLDLFRHVDRVLCEGPHMLECIAKLGCPTDKLQVHHLGVPLERLPYRPRVWSSGKPLRVLMAASFQEKKGIPYGLQALARLKKDVPIEVTVVGDANGEPRSQAEKKRILETIQKAGLEGDVRLLGYQPYAALIQQAYEHHVFLAPSVTAGDGDTEGGAPVTLIEVLATGMPVVSSWHCDIPEIVRDGITGYLAPERDVEGLCDALRRLVANAANWTEMQAAARSHIEKEFDAKCQGARLADIYRTAAGS